jgi:metallo-beta-lactamase family protein
LEDRVPHLSVFLDSSMAVSITDVFERHPELFDQEMTKLARHNRSPFDFPGLKMIRTVDESKAINHIHGTIMIIAGSGMCTGGRIKHHLVVKYFQAREHNTICWISGSGYTRKRNH